MLSKLCRAIGKVVGNDCAVSSPPLIMHKKMPLQDVLLHTHTIFHNIHRYLLLLLAPWPLPQTRYLRGKFAHCFFCRCCLLFVIFCFFFVCCFCLLLLETHCEKCLHFILKQQIMTTIVTYLFGQKRVFVVSGSYLMEFV